MTVIVGIPSNGRVYLGADSQTTAGSLKRHDYEGKLWQQGPIVFGLTGSIREAQILEHATTLPELPTHDDELFKWLCTDFVTVVREARKASGYDERDSFNNGVEHGPSIMLGVRGRLFVMSCDYQVCEYHDGAAIGSGSTVALGSLHTTAQYQMGPRRRIDLALAAACAHDIYCAPPFTYAISPK